MNLFFHHPAKNQANEQDKHALVSFHEHTYYANEGSEFLDDAIRMKEQPLLFTEQTAAGEVNFI